MEVQVVRDLDEAQLGGRPPTNPLQYAHANFPVRHIGALLVALGPGHARRGEPGGSKCAAELQTRCRKPENAPRTGGAPVAPASREAKGMPWCERRRGFHPNPELLTYHSGTFMKAAAGHAERRRTPLQYAHANFCFWTFFGSIGFQGRCLQARKRPKNRRDARVAGISGGEKHVVARGTEEFSQAGRGRAVENPPSSSQGFREKFTGIIFFWCVFRCAGRRRRS